MYSSMISRFRQLFLTPWSQLNAAIMFYTCIPLPSWLPVQFAGMTRFAAIVGLLLGWLLAGVWQGLQRCGLEPGLNAAIVVALWLWITGGLHLDGAMDTADGLAVRDPQRRLEVMSDSRSGAFGVMVAIVILGWKTVALASLSQTHGWVILLAAGWSRWGQQAAIVRYPYLKPQGKGAFHKANLTSAWQIVPMFWLLVGLCFLPLLLHQMTLPMAFGLAVGGGTIALATGDWFQRQLGGHTGDTYGAVVEWSEVGLLVLANFLVRLG